VDKEPPRASQLSKKSKIYLDLLGRDDKMVED
jgi:hypothetical protein